MSERKKLSGVFSDDRKKWRKALFRLARRRGQRLAEWEIKEFMDCLCLDCPAKAEDGQRRKPLKRTDGMRSIGPTHIDVYAKIKPGVGPFIYEPRPGGVQ